MSFDANDKKIYDLLNRNYFIIPRNQRKYVWNKRNWTEIFDDISFVVEKILPNHFIGSIVLKDEGRKNGLPNYQIIDGQQRITTLTIMIASIVYWMRKQNMIDDVEGTKQYLIAKNDKGKDVVMVSSSGQESLEAITNKILTCDEKIINKISITNFIDSEILTAKDKNIGDAFKFFISLIQERMKTHQNPNAYLLQLRDAIVEITYVGIVSTTEEDSYTIFEILNARGMELDDHELLKNYIMRYIFPTENRDAAKEKWSEIENLLKNDISRFIKHYAIHKFGYNKDLSTYKQIQISNRKDEVNDLLDDLRVKANYYYKLVSPRKGTEPECCNEIEYRVFSFFKKKRYWQMRPVLLSLMNKRRIGEIAEDRYNSVISYLEDFYICYNIIGDENSNKLTNCVNKFSLKIENEYDDNVLEEFLIDLVSKLPSFEMFSNSFRNIGWSHHRNFFEGEKNKDRVQTVLEVLERYKNNGYCKQDFTIEHIMDDANSVNNAMIGNLIPLENKLNSQCIGKDFIEKCKIYEESDYKTTRKFASRYRSKGSVNIEERTRLMAKEFYYDILGIDRVIKKVLKEN